MNTIEYIDTAKTRLGVDSDYALAKALKITPSTIYGYRAGRSHMDDETALKISKVLGIHAGFVLLDMHRERAKTPQERSAWQEIFEGFHALLLHAKSGRSLALPR
jgi:plasmid maintenance system antidote protein VapI